MTNKDELTKECKTYYLLAGEGEHGIWSEWGCTPEEMLATLEEERCHGDRWARAYDVDGYNIEDINDRVDVSHMREAQFKTKLG